MSVRRSSQRFHCLNAEQVAVLDQVLSEVVPIHGRGNFPTLELRPCDIITAVRARLEKQGILVRDVRLNGSTASHVLVRDNGTSYKDLDIIFGVELPRQEDFQVIKESVLGCLLDCLPAGVNRERISSATMKEAYVQKMVKVFNEHDRWSLISLSNNSGKNLELKFVSVLRRQFEFSVDSFQIILDRLLESYLEQESREVGSEKNHSVSPAEHAAAQKTERLNCNGKDLRSNESAPIKNPEHHDDTEDTHKQEPQAEHSQQTGNLDQTNHSKQEGDESQGELSKQKKSRKRSEGVVHSKEMDQTSHSICSETEIHSNETEMANKADLFQQTALQEPSGSSAENEHPEQSDQEQLQPPEVSDDGEKTDQIDFSIQMQSSDQARPLVKQEEFVTQTEKMNPLEHKTQAEPTNLAEQSCKKEELNEGSSSECSSEGQGKNEEDPAHSPCTLDATTSTETEVATHSQLMDAAKTDTHDCSHAERKKDIENDSEVTLEVESADIDQTSGIGYSSLSCSSLALTTDNADIVTQHALASNMEQADKSENISDTVDAANPPDTQDTSLSRPRLVSDKQTPCLPSSKASNRLSQMVVLKHSSPKPPRRMCRKVTSNPNPSLASATEPARASNADPNSNPNPNPGITSNPDLGVVSTSISPLSSEIPPSSTIILPAEISFETGSDTIAALHQEPSAVSQPAKEVFAEITTVDLKESPPTQVACDEQSQIGSVAHIKKETSSLFKESEPPDSLAPHSSICCTHTQESTHTSEVEFSDEDESRELQFKMMDLDQPPSVQTGFSSPPPMHCVTTPIPSVTPPVLSLSPPSFSLPSPSLSPPPCLTPPSHCPTSPMLSVSPPPSFSSPPLSFSPTSSCLSSPPYLTPPLLSLSPPPPCLSPPLLCLTQSVSPERLAPQVSTELKPSVPNTECEGQITQSSPQTSTPLQQSQDEKEQDSLSSLRQVPEPVSYLLTDWPSLSKPKELPDSTPPVASEASSSVPEKKEAPAPVVPTDMPAQSKPPQASRSVPTVEVLAESMYGDFEAAMDHLRYRLIATRNPEEIRGGGLLKYSNLLVRDYRPASETQIKTLERYMCSRFFIDFPDVQEQQRKILSYLKNHFLGEERSKYQYLMTLRRVVDDSTVCLMGHERRQTLNMITVLALKVLGEQNIIPNTDHVTCFYQPAPYLAEHSAPYLAEPSYCSYYIPQGGSTLLYQPYPLHLHSQTGLV